MRVGFNALHLVPGETGGSELYARRLVETLVGGQHEVEATVFVGHEGANSDWPDPVQLVEVPVHARSRPARVLAEQTLLPRAARRADVELLHNLFTTAPALPGVPQVTTILDVIYKRYPETHSGLLTHGMRLLVSLAARQSRRILTLSEAAKEDIVRFLRVPADRVDVTYLGPGLPDDITPMPEDELRRLLRIGDEPIVLTVSAKRPHKNLERLISAVGTLETPANLVVPGYATPFEEDLRAHAERVAPGRVVFTGWVDSQMLEGLYRAAMCLAFPSLAEGFGLPVLEAMRRGLPVACSNATSLPELAGDAALYFNPTETEAIQGALERLLGDSRLRERLSAAGQEQAKKFTWGATAQATLQSYERALSARS